MKRSLLDDDRIPYELQTSGLPSSPAISVTGEPEFIDSPSKRGRSTPPPVLRGPLYFSSQGELAPSTVPPQPSNLPGVRRLVPRDALLRLHMNGQTQDTDMACLLAATARRVIFIFENAEVRASEQVLALPALAAVGLVVNNVPPAANPFGIIGIEDPVGSLARECRVLDTLGGNVATPCLVFVEDDELRATVMLRRPLHELERAVRLWLS